MTVLRRPANVERQAAPLPPLPGPLKILVAVGAPDEGTTSSSVLDLEAELQGILDAVEQAAQHGNAQVRILEVGHPEEIRKALVRDTFHVLHLSGHGAPGQVELEDEEGRSYPVTARELAEKIRAGGRPLPLVFLSSCHGGVAAGETGSEAGSDRPSETRSETTSFAQGLVQEGIPLVLAMQSRVTDLYASRLAGRFYQELCQGDQPLAGRALAQARRLLEAERRRLLTTGAAPVEETQPEYATACLFTAGAESPILDHALEQEPLQASPVHTVTGPLPQLRVGDLVGRRQELRETLGVLRDDPRALAAHGRPAGVQLLGMGGVGKSSIAGRVMTRLQENDWLVAAWSGAFHLGEVARSMGEAIEEDGAPELQEAGRALRHPQLDDESRWRLLLKLLQSRRQLVLILDNFETNLTLDGKAYLDPALALQMERLAGAAGSGKLLVTSRHPLPGADAELYALHVGPLSPAQTRKLAWRLPALDQLRRQEPRDFAGVLRRIGGHPRMLEYLDGLLRRGQGQFPWLTRRLKELAEKVGVDLDAGEVAVDEAARQALLLGAEDILLDALLREIEASGDLEVLLQAAVSTLPLELAGLAWALQDGEAWDDADRLRELRRSVERLCQSSLLTPLGPPPAGGDSLLWVHRWTAESLAGRHGGEAHGERCRRMGEYRMWRVKNVSHALDDGMAAVASFLAGRVFDRAAEEALGLTQALVRFRQLASAGALATEVLQSLPEEHASYALLADVELQANRALGFTGLARERAEKWVEIFERKARAEPDRADYQRDLSVSYERLGDLLGALGQGEAARKAYQDALEIRERLARAEPQRADYQVDLVVPLHRLAQMDPEEGANHLGRAHQILVQLADEGRLAPQYQPWLEQLEKAVAGELGPGREE